MENKIHLNYLLTISKVEAYLEFNVGVTRFARCLVEVGIIVYIRLKLIKCLHTFLNSNKSQGITFSWSITITKKVYCSRKSKYLFCSRFK